MTIDLKQYYALYLDDFSRPSCTSGVKTYFGSLNEITQFIGELQKSGEYKKTVEAFQKYQKGQIEATHIVAYSEHKLMEPIEVIDDFKTAVIALDFEYINPYGCKYHVRIDRADISAILIKMKDCYVRCIKPSVFNFKYENEFCIGEPWHILEGGFWGHPEILAPCKKDKDIIIESRLYMAESFTEDKSESLEIFRKKPFDMNIFCEDVFGDG